MVFTYYLLKSTDLGYHIRAVGEKKEAAEAMGRQTALGSAAASLLFGVADAVSNAAAAQGLPSDLVKTIPYLATLIGLTIFSVRTYKRQKEV